MVKLPEMINTTMASTPAARNVSNFKESMFDAMTPIEEGNAESKQDIASSMQNKSLINVLTKSRAHLSPEQYILERQ